MPNTHVVAVDGSAEADAALKFALDAFPKEDTFIVVHERHARSKVSHPGNLARNQVAAFAEQQAMFEHYAQLCNEKQRNCVFKDLLEAGGISKMADEVGHNICNFARGVNANSVVVGQRGIGALQKALMGSTSSVSASELAADADLLNEMSPAMPT